jgi:hypothetical protein
MCTKMTKTIFNIMSEVVKLRNDITEVILTCNLKLCPITCWFACSFKTKKKRERDGGRRYTGFVEYTKVTQGINYR